MGNRNVICTPLRTAAQLPSSMLGTIDRDTTPITGNRSAIYTLLKTAPQLPSSLPSMTRHRRMRPIAANRGDFHAVPVNAASNLHSGSSLNAGGKDQPTDDAGQAETAAAPAFGDSFHFKKEMGASKATDVVELHVGHAPDCNPPVRAAG